MSSFVKNAVADGNKANFDLIQIRIESLSSKMDKLIHIQEKVLGRLDGMSQDIDGIENDMENLKVDKEEIHLPPRMVNQTQVVGREVREICQEMSTIMSAVNQRSEQQAQKLEGMEKLVLSMQQVISFIGETVKSSRIMKLMFKNPAARKVSKDTKSKKAIKKKSSTDTINKKPEKKRESSLLCHSTVLVCWTPKKRWPMRVKDHKSKDGIDKPCLSPKDLNVQKKMKLPETTENISLKKQALLLEEVQKLNRENVEKSDLQPTPEHLDAEAGAPPEDQQPEAPVCSVIDSLCEDSPVVENLQIIEVVDQEKVDDKQAEVKPEEKDEEVVPEHEDTSTMAEEITQEVVTAEEKAAELRTPPEDKIDPTPTSEAPKEAEQDQEAEGSSTCTAAVTEQDSVTVHSPTQSTVLEEGPEGSSQGLMEEKKTEDKEEEEEKAESEDWAIFKADGVEFQINLKERLERERTDSRAEQDEKDDDADDDAERYFIDTSSPPSAPFNHRIVSAKPNQIINFYTINWQEVLGGGRFGQVHKCVENSSGLTLAAKVIKARSLKEKEVVKNEIQVMNNLDHANLIQLYAAYESRNDIILVLEYVGGGELFDRIIDENYTLMELDAVMFIRQICEGLQHMHKMYVLHLDLKPENILCVSRLTNKIKIIDFGLARVYKPREKLRVNFGTPEFLAPEVINYDFVSFKTDMWSLGVITYMLLSGLSPFLGDDDNETLNNILAAKWNFDEPEFADTSEEAKDFISRMLIVNKGWRMGASEAMRHPWLSNSVLHHHLYTKKTMCRSRRSSCVPTADS
ncbi:myosin light chain kinase 2, skeletal/cardiac muscle isoform X3 [Takifugu rubripes]|uniref:Myosin light chain kinase family member 4 n=1 Tax=Takifugu rubripes TaxID=31033 RepID=A0A674N229_TAKRU|nr:myosin light chain kinase 2, skeletal/cardiac muscle-like isoform X3 [Takifugu rubripes]